MVLETKYGEFKITGIRLRTALDTAIMLHEKSITSFNKEQFYKITESAPSSHGPIDKLVDMVRFGLLVKNDQNLVITPLCDEFLKSSGEERSKIIERIIRNIPLWNKLLDTVGKNPAMDKFSSSVRDLTKANSDLIDRNLTKLYSAYIGDIDCINKSPPYGVTSPLKGRTRGTGKSQRSVDYVDDYDVSDVTVPPIEMSINFGDHRVDIKDELTYRFAEQTMVMIRRELARRGVRIAQM
jgi:hypothetical protein